jgi:hypothetical protein
MVCMSSFTEIGSGIQKLVVGYTDSQTGKMDIAEFYFRNVR